MMRKPLTGFALATACDKHYFLTCLNLIGSVTANSDIFSSIYIADLGLTRWQRQLLRNVPGVKLLSIPPFAPHFLQCWSWKPWVWHEVKAASLIYLDAGIEVLRDLTEVHTAIQKDGYFLVSQNNQGGDHTVDAIMPSDYYDRLKLPRSQAKRDVVGAGIIGFSHKSDFFQEVITPELQLAKEGFCLGWSSAEITRNHGIHYMTNPPIRDCQVFRHDQTLLNALVYRHYNQPRVHSLIKYATYQSPHEHPEQLLWHHRRQSSLPWLNHVDFRQMSWACRLLLISLRGWRNAKRRILKRQTP